MIFGLPPRSSSEDCALLRHYAASSGNSLQTFWGSLSVHSSKVQGSKWKKQTGPIDCPETSVRNYRYSLHNNPEERSSVTWFITSCVSEAVYRRFRGLCHLQIKPYNVGIIFLRNVGNVLPDFTVSHNRKPQCCRGRGKPVQITWARRSKRGLDASPLNLRHILTSS